MKLSSLCCVVCIAAIVTGEEIHHQHHHLNESTSEALIDKRPQLDHSDHDHHDHHDHDHHDHHEDHGDIEQLPLEGGEVDNPGTDYVIWLAATGES